MKSLVFASVGALAFSMAGCVSVPSTVTELQQLVQQDTQAICSFLPTVETLDQIAAVWVPSAAGVIQDANQIATEICAAVQTPPAPSIRAHLKAGDIVINVNGKPVVIHGGFVSAAKHR